MKDKKQKIQECSQWVRENGLMDCGGATLKQFCKAMDIHHSTYYEWIKDPDFSEAIKEAKEDFKSTLEMDIVASLAKVAKGYKYQKKKIIIGKDRKGNETKKQEIDEVEVQPNVGAGIFLLTNIAPDRWRNKISNEVDAQVRAETKNETTYNLDGVDKKLLTQFADALQDAQKKKEDEAKKK